MVGQWFIALNNKALFDVSREYLMNVLISQGRSCRLIGDCAVVAAVTVPFVAGVIY